MINFKENVYNVMNKENISYRKNGARTKHYQNDELDVEVYNLSGDYATMTVSYLDEQDYEHKNKVCVIRDKESITPYVRIVFTFENGDILTINFNEDREIKFTTMNGNNVKCASNISNELYWYELDRSRRGTIKLDAYGAENFVDKMYYAITNGVQNPKFDKLFEIIKPILIQSTLEISVANVNRLYSLLEENNSDIASINLDIDKAKNNYERNELQEQVDSIIAKNDRIKELINDIQDCVFDEYYPIKGKMM